MDVLLVEDEPDVSRVLSRFLAQRGFTVRTSENGREALARIDERRPDVIVSDIKMAVVNGIELLHVVRDRFPGLPCILMTGYEDIAATQAAEQGAFELLRKPLRLTQLLDSIERAGAYPVPAGH